MAEPDTGKRTFEEADDAADQYDSKRARLEQVNSTALHAGPTAPAAAVAVAPPRSAWPDIEPAVSRTGLKPELPVMPDSLVLATGVPAAERAQRAFVSQEDVGIIGYAGGGDLPGIKGVIKQRFTDFLVYEVPLSGDIVSLKDIGKPVEPMRAAPGGEVKAVHTLAADVKTEPKIAHVEAASTGFEVEDSSAPAESAPAEAAGLAAVSVVPLDAAAPELPDSLRFESHPQWSRTATQGMRAHFSDETIIALHALFIEGRTPPPKSDGGWGARAARDTLGEEENGLNAPIAEEEAFSSGRGGRGQGRDRGRGRGQERGRGRGGRGGQPGRDTPWKPADTREVVSQPIAEKDKRAAAHKAVRELFKEQFDTSARDIDGGSCIVIKWATALIKARNAQRERGRSERLPNYIHFTLHKTNRETQDCLGHLARLLGCSSRDLTVCGTKDKRAVTVQRVCLKRNNRNLVAVWRAANSINNGRRTDSSAVTQRGERGTRIGDLSYDHQYLELGMLKGNHFKITLRNVSAKSTEEIDRQMASLRDYGFINFFGMQRFGTSSVPTHITGLSILRQEWTEALDSILSLREGEHPDCARGRLAWLEDRDVAKALQIMPRRCVAERSIWEFWNRGNPQSDKVGALGNIPRTLRTMYVHAYQSYIWNVGASERIKLSRTKPLVGDLVYLDPSAGDLDESAAPSVPKYQQKGRAPRANDNSSSRDVKHLTAEDVASGQYTMFDIILPLPGFDVEYPTGEIGDLYTRLLQADGLDPTKMRREQREYSLPGSYRKLLVRPADLSWEHIRYTDPDLALVQSDEDRLLGLNEAAVDDPNGIFRALKVSLTLGSSTYATMALREITREETATWHQMGLTRAGDDQAHKGTSAIAATALNVHIDADAEESEEEADGTHEGDAD